MNTPLALRAAALLALASSGCYSAVNPDKIKPPQTPSAICTGAYDQLLAKSAQCFHSPTEWVDATAGTPACADYDRAVANGRIAVDPGKLGACQNEIAAADCLTLFATPATGAPGACGQLIQGQVQVNGACYVDGECVGGTYCRGLTCPGTCTSYGGSGAPCGTATDPFCGAGLTCLGPAQTCQPYLSSGADCSANRGACAPGLVCDTSTLPTPSLTCVTAAPGVACAGPGACPVPGLVCVGYTLTTPGNCQVAKGVGRACIVGQHECAYGAYCAGSAVGATGTCTLYPSTLNASFACGVVLNELVDCIGGYCAFTSPGVGSCVSYIAPSQLCDISYPLDSSVQCGRFDNGYWCDPGGSCRYYRCTEP